MHRNSIYFFFKKLNNVQWMSIKCLACLRLSLQSNWTEPQLVSPLFIVFTSVSLWLCDCKIKSAHLCLYLQQSEADSVFSAILLIFMATVQVWDISDNGRVTKIVRDGHKTKCHLKIFEVNPMFGFKLGHWGNQMGRFQIKNLSLDFQFFRAQFSPGQKIYLLNKDLIFSNGKHNVFK